jgi:hypothetical protein
MAIQKQNIEIDFLGGLDTKTDPHHVKNEKFLELTNMVYYQGALLLKRNGFGVLTAPPKDANYLTTYRNNLIALGNSLYARSEATQSYVNRGAFPTCNVSTLSLVRSSLNQTASDVAIAPSGLACGVYTNTQVGATPANTYYYQVFDSQTGQIVVGPAAIPQGTGAISGSQRVFCVGNYFLIVFTNTISATVHLQYLAINTQSLAVASAAVDISTQYTPSGTVAFDGVVTNNTLYIAWNGNDGGNAIRYCSIFQNLNQSATKTIAGKLATLFSATVDLTPQGAGVTATPVVWFTYYDVAGGNGYSFSVDVNLNTLTASTQVVTGNTGYVNISSTAQNGILSLFLERKNSLGTSLFASNYLQTLTLTQSATVGGTGSAGSTTVLVRSVGLASKAFLVNGISYFLTAYQSQLQNTYFLMNGSGQAVAKVAYSNGGGYCVAGLPSATLYNGTAYVAYLYKDLIESQASAPANLNFGISNNVYSQTGVNLAGLQVARGSKNSIETAHNLLLASGFVWQYDGNAPVEHGFHLYPDTDGFSVSTGAAGGGMALQKYYYQFTYEWMDAAGNLNRSSPSIPYLVDLTNLAASPLTFTSNFAKGVSSITASSSTGLFVGQILTDSTTAGNIALGTYIAALVGTTITLSQPTVGASAGGAGDTLQTVDTAYVVIANIPSLRLTYKNASSIKIAGYRWSTAQQSYYQFTSLQSPTLNPNILTTDAVLITDSNPDNAILGNNLLYTTGGVVENIAAPASLALTLYDTRAWLIDAEDRNLLWYSKQNIEAVPVEFSDLFTYYVDPSVGVSGPTGDLGAFCPMDEKLILFKKDSIFYINGTGPDNTGANSQYSQPIFITAAVGSVNQASILLTPLGIMFESSQGIWLLGRNLQTQYVGSDVEAFTNAGGVTSAVSIPGTTEVRFQLDSGTLLSFNYYYNQWSVFNNPQGISSTLYQGQHTYLGSDANIYQETPGSYLDNSYPVLLGFKTSWLKFAGVQGYQRAYWLDLLGTYYSPHKLQVMIAYDYNPSPSQSVLITPANYAPPFGGGPNPNPTGTYPAWGTDPVYGYAGNQETWQIHLARQRCEAFQIQLQEVFDPTYQTVAGQGFSLSSINCTVGIKKGRYPRKAANQIG